MDYTSLGTTGLKVSRICLGCMTYGVPERGAHPWSLDEEKSRPFIKRALELGINFFDTANAYSDGTSEEIVGRALRDFARREEIVLATKVFFPMRAGANARGLSRKSIMIEIDASLQRLGTDYVDLYQIHRWDDHTPIEETWTPFVSMQNHYNLLYREEEREMMPLCASEGVGVIPWSPLARGRLTRPWNESTERMENDEFGKTLYTSAIDSDRKIVEQVAAVAAQRGVPAAQVALAWMLQKPFITAPIVGASKPHHLDDAVAALTINLSPEEIASLEESYAPRPVSGF